MKKREPTFKKGKNCYSCLLTVRRSRIMRTRTNAGQRHGQTFWVMHTSYRSVLYTPIYIHKTNTRTTVAAVDLIYLIECIARAVRSDWKKHSNEPLGTIPTCQRWKEHERAGRPALVTYTYGEPATNTSQQARAIVIDELEKKRKI